MTIHVSANNCTAWWQLYIKVPSLFIVSKNFLHKTHIKRNLKNISLLFVNCPYYNSTVKVSQCVSFVYSLRFSLHIIPLGTRRSFHNHVIWNPYVRVVSIEVTLPAWWFKVRIPTEARDFVCFISPRPALGLTQPPIYHSALPSTKVKN